MLPRDEGRPEAVPMPSAQAGSCGNRPMQKEVLGPQEFPISWSPMLKTAPVSVCWWSFLHQPHAPARFGAQQTTQTYDDPTF